MSYCTGKYKRTLQEECTGNYYLESEPLKQMDDKVSRTAKRPSKEGREMNSVIRQSIWLLEIVN